MDNGQRYIHGYEEREGDRLVAQASSVRDLLHSDTRYPPGTRVLEVGCGTGAQTVSLALNSPHAHFLSFDRSAVSLAQAAARLKSAGVTNVDLIHADLNGLPFEAESFDHVFICFVLEHLSKPVEALLLLKNLLKPGGTITLFEGDHGSAYFHPHSDLAHRAIDCQVALQCQAGGNACIGRQLYPNLLAAGYAQARVSPRMVYVDGTRPQLADSFTRKTFTAMVESVRAQAIEAEIIDAVTFDAGIRDLFRAAEPGGVFCYTFFKGTALKPVLP